MELDLARFVRRGGDRRRLALGQRNGDAGAPHLDPDLLRLQPADLHTGLGLHLHIHRQALALLQIRRRRRVQRDRWGGQRLPEQCRVLLPCHEPWERAVADVDAGQGREDGDSGRLVDVNELLVGVVGGDVDVDPGGDRISGGDVEGCDADGGDVEGRAVRAVDGVEDAYGDGEEDDENDDEEGEPEAAGAAAAPAPLHRGRLCAVHRRPVSLRLRRWKRSAVGGAATVRLRRWLLGGRREDSILHGRPPLRLLSLRLLRRRWIEIRR